MAAVVKTNGIPFWLVGAPPISVYFSGDWDVMMFTGDIVTDIHLETVLVSKISDKHLETKKNKNSKFNT